MHGSTGTPSSWDDDEHLQSCFDDLSEAGFDLGGSGPRSGRRAAASAGRCEWACVDSLDLCHT
jgi:sulfite reductase alpha subunit